MATSPAATPSSPAPAGPGAESSGAPTASGDSASRHDARPKYQSADDFLSGDNPSQITRGDVDPREELPSQRAELPPDATPDTVLRSLLDSLPPEHKSAADKYLRDQAALAGRAPVEQRRAEANYQSAAAHAAIAQAAIERLRGAGIDVSDLAGGDPGPGQAQRQARAEPPQGDFDMQAVSREAMGILSPEWAEKILDGYDRADALAQSANDLDAAGDTNRASVLRKQAREIRLQLTLAQSRSAALASSSMVDKSYQALQGRFGELSGRLEAGTVEAEGNAAVGEALHLAADTFDGDSRVWVDRGFFDIGANGNPKFSDLGRELIGPMAEYAHAGDLDLRDPEVFEAAFYVALGKSGRIRRGTAQTAVRRPSGDPTSSLTGQGSPSVALPRSTTGAQVSESPAERAARANRRGFSAAI